MMGAVSNVVQKSSTVIAGIFGGGKVWQIWQLVLLWQGLSIEMEVNSLNYLRFQVYKNNL